MRTVPAAALALSLGAPALAQQPAPIDSMALRAHTYFLSHDLLEGRGTGTRGSELAALYLAGAAERLGLAAAGPGGSWFHPVRLVDATIDTARTAVTVSDSSGSQQYRSPVSFIPNVGTARTLVDFGGELAWVGTAPDIIAHAERLPPLEGRVAVMAGVFGAAVAAADTLRARGASGVIQFVGNNETYDLYVHSRGNSRMYPADSSVHSSFIPDIPTVIARADLVRRLLAGATEEQLERPFSVRGRRVQVTIRTRPRLVEVRNVMAVVRGTDARLRDEYVAYTAHYDHLGIGAPDSSRDSIYNGFSDNAAGSAMLLALAQYFARHPPPRSVLFIWFTGEERGLLGSDIWVANPVIPLERIVGVINLDAGAPPARSVQWRMAGADRSGLGPVVTGIGRELGWDIQGSGASPNTDYFPFLRLGVPAIFIVPGPAPYEGLTTDSTQALRRRWDHYHQAADNWHADFPFEGLVRYAELALRVGLRIASGPAPARAR